MVDDFELYPRQAIAALKRMRDGFGNPAMAAREFVDDLAANDMPQLAALASRDIALL